MHFKSQVKLFIAPSVPLEAFSCYNCLKTLSALNNTEPHPSHNTFVVSECLPHSFASYIKASGTEHATRKEGFSTRQRAFKEQTSALTHKSTISPFYHRQTQADRPSFADQGDILSSLNIRALIDLQK